MKKTILFLWIILITQFAAAQNHYHKYGLSFDYPNGVSITESSFKDVYYTITISDKDYINIVTIIFGRMLSSSTVEDMIINNMQGIVNEINIDDFLYGDFYNTKLNRYSAIASKYKYSVQSVPFTGIIKGAAFENNKILLFGTSIIADMKIFDMQAIENSIHVDD